MKVCPFCSQPLPDSATDCTRCGRSQTFNEDNRPALGWPGCVLFGGTLVFSVLALALLMGILFGWMPRALGSTWGGTILLLLLLALAGHRLRGYLESRQDRESGGQSPTVEVEILEKEEEGPAKPAWPEREDNTQGD